MTLSKKSQSKIFRSVSKDLNFTRITKGGLGSLMAFSVRIHIICISKIISKQDIYRVS